MGDVNNIILNVLHSKEILPNDGTSIHPVSGLFCAKRPCLGGRCSKEVEGGLFTQFRVWSAPNDPIGIVDAARWSRGLFSSFGVCFVPKGSVSCVDAARGSRGVICTVSGLVCVKQLRVAPGCRQRAKGHYSCCFGSGLCERPHLGYR